MRDPRAHAHAYVLCSASKSRSTAMEQKTRRTQNPAEPTHTRVGALLAAPNFKLPSRAPETPSTNNPSTSPQSTQCLDATQCGRTFLLPTILNTMPSSSTSKCSRYFFLLVRFRACRERQHGSILRIKKNRNRKNKTLHSLVLGKVIKFSRSVEVFLYSAERRVRHYCMYGIPF